MYVSNCKTVVLLCYGEPHLFVLYSTTWTRRSGRGTGRTVTQQQKICGEAVGAVAQASRGRRGPGGETAKAILKQKSWIEGLPNSLTLDCSPFCVLLCDFAFLLRCVWFLKDQGKARVPNIGNQEPSRASLQLSWIVLCLETSSASTSQRVNPLQAAEHTLLPHVEESCRHTYYGMAQSKETGQEFHSLAEGWASQEDRSPDTGQHQPKSPSHNREQRLPSSPHPAIATHTPPHAALFSQLESPTSPLLTSLPNLPLLNTFPPLIGCRSSFQNLCLLSMCPSSQPQSTTISHISCIP